jgi:hypothetical protein
MKKLIVGLLILSGCAVQPKFGYRVSEWNVYKEDKVIAKVTSTELEMMPNGKKIMEISLTLESHAGMLDAEQLLEYLHQKYPKAKIEINLDEIEKYK